MPEAGAVATRAFEAVAERLADAIQDGQLRDVLTALRASEATLTDDARQRVAQAAAAVAAIDAAVATERARLAGQMTAYGVTPAPSSTTPGARPLHIASFSVSPHDVDRANEALTACGYRRLAPTTAAAWRAFRSTRGACLFVRSDRDPFRVELTWSLHPLSARGALGRLLTPQTSDFDAIGLPEPLWPLYSLVRLMRLPARRLSRHREPPDLGPFLTTPTALIEPLLNVAGVSARDLVVDLGCGDGRIAIAAATLTGCRARGLETNAELVARARAAVAEASVADRVEIRHADASTAPLDDADVVIAFLPVTTIEQILPSVLARMKRGARLVVHEQERLHTLPAEARVPLLSADGVTVAHRWTR